MEQTEAKSESTPNISIPGFSRLYHQGWKMKIFWIIAILCCIGLCVYQITDRITFYLKFPIKTKMNITRLQTVWFPAFTICPGLLFEHMRRVDHNSSFNDGADRQSMSADDVWEYYKIPMENIVASVPCWTSTKDDDCDDDMLVEYELNKMYINTTWGKCVMLEPVQPLEYHGPFTRIILKLDFDPNYGDLDRSRIAPFTVLLHSKESPIRHDGYFYAEYVKKFHDITIRFTAREFNFLNRKNYPCLPGDENQFCRNRCIDAKIESSVTCRLPFVSSRSKLTYCKNWNETKLAYGIALQVYSDLQATDCVCTKRCNEIVYNTRLDDKGYNSLNVTKIVLYYDDNLHEVVSEIYMYSVSALLSDIGGNMGLFLGACALTWMEVLETLIKQLWALRKGGRKVSANAQQVST